MRAGRARLQHQAGAVPRPDGDLPAGRQRRGAAAHLRARARVVRRQQRGGMAYDKVLVEGALAMDKVLVEGLQGGELLVFIHGWPDDLTVWEDDRLRRG